MQADSLNNTHIYTTICLNMYMQCLLANHMKTDYTCIVLEPYLVNLLCENSTVINIS